MNGQREGGRERVYYPVWEANAGSGYWHDVLSDTYSFDTISYQQ